MVNENSRVFRVMRTVRDDLWVNKITPSEGEASSFKLRSKSRGIHMTYQLNTMTLRVVVRYSKVIPGWQANNNVMKETSKISMQIQEGSLFKRDDYFMDLIIIGEETVGTSVFLCIQELLPGNNRHYFLLIFQCCD